MALGSSERPLYEIKANLFKGLAHPYRIRVLEILSGADEVPVSDILTDTGLEASHLSQHLAVLRRHQLVASERRASIVYYRLSSPAVADLLRVSRELLVDVLQHAGSQLASIDELPSIAGRA